MGHLYTLIRTCHSIMCYYTVHQLVSLNKHHFVFRLKCQPCIAVIKYNIHGSPNTPNLKMFIIEVSNRSEKKFADMDLRLAVVLLVAVVYLSTAAGMNCLNSFFSSSIVLLDSSY